MGLLSQSQQQYYSTASPSVFGEYQFTSLENIIDQFIIAYVGEQKIISKISRTDVAFHAQRALQELSFDTFKSTKSQEIIIPPSLTMVLPQDYVNYVKITYTDNAGIEHIVYPVSKTSNPFKIVQDANSNQAYTFDGEGNLATTADSRTWDKYKTHTNNEANNSNDQYDDGSYDLNVGQRYGLDPQYAQTNGSFYIDELKGKIHFSSSFSGVTVTLKYISDSLGTDAEMQVHKFAEEAMYKSIAYAILSTSANVQEYIVRRFKKDRFAAIRTAKLRLSNIKLEEISQVLRGKSKQIKH
tara:strand:+ start:41 stop:934 length:894 start_codon:yes stop_codon:yes gene_type:complete